MFSENPELIAAGIALLIALADAARRYKDADDIPLYALPFAEIRALADALRHHFFTIDRPDHPTITVKDMDLEELRTTLAKQGVKPGHIFSYVYEGEDYNGIFYYKDPDRKYPHRQIHIRGFQMDNGIELMCHEEPCWYHHPRVHIKSSDMEHSEANEWARQRLEYTAPVEYPPDN